MSILIACLFFVDLFPDRIIDRSSRRRPEWIKEIPSGRYFLYYTGLSSSTKSLEEAKDLAISSVMSSIIMSREVTVDSVIESHETVTETDLISRVTRDIKLKGSTSVVQGLEKHEDYWEIIKSRDSFLHRYWILMRIPKLEYRNHSFSPLELEPKYGITPIMKSAIVPGWGQIDKKETRKGVFILSGFVIAFTSGIITNNLSNSYAQDAENTTGADWIKYYNDLSNQYYIASIVSFSLAGAIYGYNVFDAITSKGVKIYAFNDETGIYFACSDNNTIRIQLSIRN